ncbi:MAG: hypothetical protein K8J31_05010 [Anaerolineae bacterium]|nr:hypothetical protein [Anaerolineae bacterium]
MYKTILSLLMFLTLALPATAQEDSIRLDWPPPVYHLTGTVVIGGTVNPPDLQSYFLEQAVFDPANPDVEPFWIPASLPSSAPVTNGVLATWDTTPFPDGFYQLRLHVLLQSGESVYRVVRPLRIANTLEPQGESVQAAPTVAPQAQVTVAVPTIPAPAATEEAAAIVPRPNPVNQLPVAVGGHVSQFKDSTVTLMQSAGMTWMKWQIPYTIGDDSLIDVARDRINFSHENGFHVLLSVKGSKDELGALGADYYPQFADFLGRIAQLGPEAIQVWNEQNIDREWPNGQINPASYVEMLRQAHEAIKAVDPEIMVITGAPAPTGAEGAFGLAAVWNDDRYYAGMAQAGAASYADCIGVHYNEGIVPPTATSGDPRNFYPTQYLPLMLQRAAQPFFNFDVPLCFSEMGYLSPEGYGPLPQSFNWAANTSVVEQAEWLRDAISTIASFQQKRVALVIIWNVDFDVYTEDDPQGGYAIIRPDGTCPACQTIGSLRQTG